MTLNALNSTKPPKPVKVKPPSKLEREISDIQAAKPIEPEPVPPTEPESEPTEPVVEVVKEPKQKVLRKEAPIKQQRKPLMVYTPPPTPPPVPPPPTGFQRNSFGFYVL
jgi:hypothetical protein